MSETYYTLICNKDESDDYCRGCLMERYSNDFQWISTTDKEELIKLWAECEYSNLYLGHGETGYDFYFLIDGRPDDTSDLYFELRDKAKKIAQVRKQEYEEKKTRDKIEAERKKEERKKQEELKQYLELKEKYGDGK